MQQQARLSSLFNREFKRGRMPLTLLESSVLSTMLKIKYKKQSKNLERRPASGAYASGSVENYALKVVEAEMKIAKYEEQVKKIFMAKGKTPLYQRMMRIREEERHPTGARGTIKQIGFKGVRKLRKEQELKNLVFVRYIASQRYA